MLAVNPASSDSVELDEAWSDADSDALSAAFSEAFSEALCEAEDEESLLAVRFPFHCESDCDEAFSDADSEALSDAFSDADSEDEAEESLLPVNVASTDPFHSELVSVDVALDSVWALSLLAAASSVVLAVAAVLSVSLAET